MGVGLFFNELNMKSFYFVFLSLLFLTSCGGKEQKHIATQAITTAEAVRDQWLRSRKHLELSVDTEQPGALAKMDKLGVFSHSQDATEEERLSLNGVSFRYHSAGKFLPDGREIVTGDSTAIFYVCYPYMSGVTPEDTLWLNAPYGEYLYGREVSRWFGERFTVKLRMECATSLLRFRLESENITDLLRTFSVTGPSLFTRAGYSPYTGEWHGLSGGNCPIEYRFDRVMNNYQYVDVLLPPVGNPSDINVTVGINSKVYTLHTTIPRLKRGEMTQINLMLDASGLRITSSWVEEQREFLFARKNKVDTVRVGHYLQDDGSVSAVRDSGSVAVVFATDGKHGKAVALKDCEGMKLFSSQKLASGRVFLTVDGTKKEGFINPSRTGGIEEEHRLVYKPSLPYPETCALGFTDGCALCRTLLRKYEEKKREGITDNEEDMLEELLTTKGAYVPALAELVHVYYMFQPYAEQTLSADGLELPKGEYLSSSETSDANFYMFDFSHGAVTGTFPKKFARMKLRLFYVF